jgi:hypothetical protein
MNGNRYDHLTCWLNRVMISFSLVIDEKVAPSFGQFLLGKMDSLFEEFDRQNSK